MVHPAGHNNIVGLIVGARDGKEVVVGMAVVGMDVDGVKVDGDAVDSLIIDGVAVDVLYVDGGTVDGVEVGLVNDCVSLKYLMFFSSPWKWKDEA